MVVDDGLVVFVVESLVVFVLDDFVVEVVSLVILVELGVVLGLVGVVESFGLADGVDTLQTLVDEPILTQKQTLHQSAPDDQPVVFQVEFTHHLHQVAQSHCFFE